MCCGAVMDGAYLNEMGIAGQCIGVGADMFKDQLVIGGRMKTFSRRDALERHGSDDGDMVACKKSQ